MKKRAISLLIFFLTSGSLFAQANNDIVSFRQIPIDLHLQIGFLFVYALLGLLFLMIFLFYPRQRLNLHFSLYNISLALLIVNTQFFQSGAYSHVASDAEEFISRMIGMNILLFILYALGRVKPFYWWFIAYTLFIDFPLNIILSEKYAVVNEIPHAIFTMLCFWQVVVAFRNKSSGNWLISVVALAVGFHNIASILYFFGEVGVVRGPVLGITPFVVTICAVIYLALRYGSTHQSLEQQLRHVQKLSEENLRKEQEKQQLMATQNETLEKQVAERTVELKNSLNELRSTQAQLIHSEKMASLGELTAGIAHEIQNPLNFVNNFSEVNKELIDELKSELGTGNGHSDSYRKAIQIAEDIDANEEKINHHGKRADAIVKAMLQHSRIRSGEKEPTDINALADEYLRLAYHGLRAKDKAFSAKFETDFDSSVGKINIVPQDIGRVLLNLINNAFYAVTEKKQQLNGSYEPTVSVSTRKLKDKVEVKVKDNGNGISQKVIDKIFQPFFTTKPTGVGTGLGLSLSYDIVKAHGGEIKVQTLEEQGSEFVMSLPC